jgi:hypothetical protein
MDLTDLTQGLEMARQLRPAHGDADAIAALGQRPHHMAAEEARAAEYGDKRLNGNGGHGALPRVV